MLQQQQLVDVIEEVVQQLVEVVQQVIEVVQQLVDVIEVVQQQVYMCTTITCTKRFLCCGQLSEVTSIYVHIRTSIQS